MSKESTTPSDADKTDIERSHLDHSECISEKGKLIIVLIKEFRGEYI